MFPRTKKNVFAHFVVTTFLRATMLNQLWRKVEHRERKKWNIREERTSGEMQNERENTHDTKDKKTKREINREMKK